METRKNSFFWWVGVVGIGVLIAAILFRIIDKFAISKIFERFEADEKEKMQYYEEHAEEEEEE